MMLGRNLVAGIVASGWAAVLGIAVVPFYLRYMGIEAYGLVGFFVSLGVVMQLFDLGMGATINREIARARAADDMGRARRMLHTLVRVYALIAVVLVIGIVASAPWLADRWIRADNLSRETVIEAIGWMAVVIGLRFPAGLYIGVLGGMERLVRLSAINAIIATAGSVGAVLVLAFVAPTVEAYFVWQAVIAVAYLALVRHAARNGLGPGLAYFDRSLLIEAWRFSAGIGVVGVLGIVLLQADKIILSRSVSLAEFGIYAVAGLVPRTLYLFLTPAFAAIYPRMSSLVASGAGDALVRLYRHGTRLLLAIIFPLTALVVVCAEEIILLWTGDAALAMRAAPVAALLMIGTALNGAMHFAYALQLAHGDARRPLIINIVLVLLFLPALIALVDRFGILGGGLAWAGINAGYVLLGTALTHRRVLEGLGLVWLTRDVGIPLAVSVVVIGGGAAALRSLELTPLPALWATTVFAAGASALVAATVPGAAATLRRVVRLLRDRSQRR